jgi:uncharacterized repeat protein (TIGR03806 family)
MIKKYAIFSLFAITISLYFSCTDNDDEDYTDVSPVVVDLSTVPYAKLSDYHFFSGELKNQIPSTDVIPYEPISSLFTDYAHKKRFVWIPKGAKATYNGDHNILELPVGSAIIKTFYYNNVQPSNTTRIIETRIMIRKVGGWIFAEYIWNEAQTEATLDITGSYTNVEFINDNGDLLNINYRIPSETECLTCHKRNSQPIPIGIKPQSLNFEYNYGTETKNQLQKWIQNGILENNLPGTINSTVDYNDTSQPLELRVRSYLDMNCAHCHNEGSHCDYRPIRLAFNETTNSANLGVCIPPEENINSGLTKIIVPANKNRSVMYYRLNATDESIRMPLLGRSIVHTEGVQLLEQWINTLGPCN